METCPDWVRSGSAYPVTLGCSVKEPVRCIRVTDPISFSCCVSHSYLSWRWLWCKYGVVFQKLLEWNGFSVRVIKNIYFKGRTSPSGPCAAGFVCIKGATEPSPLDGLTGFPCPPGFFCSEGVTAPKPCPKGKFRFISCSWSVDIRLFWIILYSPFIPQTHSWLWLELWKLMPCEKVMNISLLF